MSTNGVILQHGAELIAYLLVDRGDNLFIGNHIKKSLPDDRRLQLGKYRNLVVRRESRSFSRRRLSLSICRNGLMARAGLRRSSLTVFMGRTPRATMRRPRKSPQKSAGHRARHAF